MNKYIWQYFVDTFKDKKLGVPEFIGRTITFEKMDPKKRFGLHNRSSQLQLVSTSVNRHRRLADVVVSKPND